MTFLSTPITYILLHICLLLEATGICEGAWVIAAVHKKIAGFQYDEVYVGTAEERAANQHADHEENVKPGHLFPGVQVPPTYGHVYTEEELDELEADLKAEKHKLEERLKALQVRRHNLRHGSHKSDENDSEK